MWRCGHILHRPKEQGGPHLEKSNPSMLRMTTAHGQLSKPEEAEDKKGRRKLDGKVGSKQEGVEGARGGRASPGPKKGSG
jgi:hypothetical protein